MMKRTYSSVFPNRAGPIYAIQQSQIRAYKRFKKADATAKGRLRIMPTIPEEYVYIGEPWPLYFSFEKRIKPNGL